MKRERLEEIRKTANEAGYFEGGNYASNVIDELLDEVEALHSAGQKVVAAWEEGGPGNSLLRLELELIEFKRRAP